MKLKLFLTFDHELPLGKLKTSYEASLFEPTQRVMALADKLGVKVTLFSDILCAYRFYEWDYERFYLPYKNQLENAIKTGHDVQLHLHPHWLTSRFEDNNFIPSADFGLSDFQSDSDTIGEIVKTGIDKMTHICQAVNPDYRCLAYRAGGFNLAPATKQILEALYAHGIKYDSSMARGYYFKSGISEVDFRNLPKAPNWKIDPENLHRSFYGAGIMEIPIATMPKTPFEVPTAFKMKKYVARAPQSHGHVIHEESHRDFAAKLKMLFAARMLTFDNYTLSLDYLLDVLNYNMRKYKHESTLMLSVISHPKSMGDYSFELMEGFVTEVRKRFPDAEFLTYSQLSPKPDLQ